MAAVPLWPSLVAVIVAVPTAAPVTSPLAVTVATDVLELAQVTVRPVSGAPFASFGVAVSCTVDPTSTVADAGATVTEATGTWTTVSAALPLCPSLVAVIVAVPATLPVTSPAALTVATVVLLLAHVTVRPVSGVPFASFGVAVSCTVVPSFTDAVAGVTSTVATGTDVGTVIAAVPLCPSLVAVIVALPPACPVTSPLALTVATLVLLLAHVIVRPVSGAPFASFGVAVSCSVLPTATVPLAGLTVTDATGTGGPVFAAFSSSASAPPFRALQLAVGVGLFAAHTAARSAAGLSPDGCSAIIVKPAPGVTASPLLVTPNTP